jgi:hypothetical protein
MKKVTLASLFVAALLIMGCASQEGTSAPPASGDTNTMPSESSTDAPAGDAAAPGAAAPAATDAPAPAPADAPAAGQPADAPKG